MGQDPQLLRLSRLRDQIRYEEHSLRKLREQRDRLVVKAAERFPERVVGHHAGLAGPYVNTLKQRAVQS
jgi:hypothetical protein